MSPRRERAEPRLDPATKAFLEGRGLVYGHPLFEPLLRRVHVVREKNNYCPADAWAIVLENGMIHAHPTRRGEPEEWAYALGHCLLHLAFGHFRVGEKSLDWNAACDVAVTRFLADLKFGRCPPEMLRDLKDVPLGDEERIFRWLRDGGSRGDFSADMYWTPQPMPKHQQEDWTRAFAAGLVASVTSAVRVAGGYEPKLGSTTESLSTA